MDDDNLPVQCHPKIELNIKKQACGYCPENKCLLDCEICNPKFGNESQCDC